MPVPHQQQRKTMIAIALLTLLVVGAVVVFMLSLRSVYRTFSTPIKPIASAPAIGANAAPPPGDSLAQQLFGVQDLSKNNRGGVDVDNTPALDAASLRTLLVLQGVDEKALSAMTDDQLIKSYQEFMARFSAGSTKK